MPRWLLEYPCFPTMVRMKGSDPAERKLLADVQNEGWSRVDIVGEKERPDYSFTVGLEHAFDHPELVIF